MSIEATLDALLTADGDVSGIVGDRIYAMIAPDSVTKPYVVYTMVISEFFVTVDDVTQREQAVFQIDCYGEVKSVLRTLADHIVDALNNATTLTLDGPSISLQPFYEPETELHRFMINATVWS